MNLRGLQVTWTSVRVRRDEIHFGHTRSEAMTMEERSTYWKAGPCGSISNLGFQISKLGGRGSSRSDCDWGRPRWWRTFFGVWPVALGSQWFQI